MLKTFSQIDLLDVVYPTENKERLVNYCYKLLENRGNCLGFRHIILDNAYLQLTNCANTTNL